MIFAFLVFDKLIKIFENKYANQVERINQKKLKHVTACNRFFAKYSNVILAGEIATQLYQAKL